LETKLIPPGVTVRLSPYLHFKDNATNKAKGKPAWIISIREYKNDAEEWLSVYHLRSIVESVFSSIKKRWGSFLRSRKKWMQKRFLCGNLVE